MKTYCFKLYKAKRNRKLHRQINAAGLIYNHCIALHKRYYRLYHRSLNIYVLQKHLTKLKKMPRFSYLKEIGAQAVQDITQRIDRAYKLFFRNLKQKVRTAPPSFKKVSKFLYLEAGRVEAPRGKCRPNRYAKVPLFQEPCHRRCGQDRHHQAGCARGPLSLFRL